MSSNNFGVKIGIVFVSWAQQHDNKEYLLGGVLFWHSQHLMTWVNLKLIASGNTSQGGCCSSTYIAKH